MHRTGAGVGAHPAHGQGPALQLLQRERPPAPVRLPPGVLCPCRVGRPYRPAHLRSHRPRRHRVLQRAAAVPPRLRLHRLYGGPDQRPASGQEECRGCALRQPRGPEHPAFRRFHRLPDLRRHLPCRKSGHQGTRLPAGCVRGGPGRRRLSHLHRHGGRDGGLHPAGRDPQPRRKPGRLPWGTCPAHHRHPERGASVEH